MPREVDGLLDTIDELVDESLSTGPVDDYNTNRYDKCWHCGRDWHGIAITERIEQMRWSGRFDETYRVADDDSPVLCPGSDFIGPVRTRPPISGFDHSAAFARTHASLLATVLPSDGQYNPVRPAIDRPQRRDLNFGVVLDGSPVWLRRLGSQLLAGFADLPDDPFDTSGWLNVGHISVDEWDFAAHDPTASDVRPSSVRSDAGIPTARRRERHQLRARTQQQAQAAQSRRELVERIRAAQPHTTREEA